MLKLENLSKYYYGSESVTCALYHINLELQIGEFVAITGESGSGKTTLLNVISGIDTFEDGEMYINNLPTSYFDKNDWELYRQNEVAFIFQNYNLIESYSVLENVLASLIIDGKTKKESYIEAKELLKKVGLENHLHKKATKLSGGQKQRLAIARALAKKARIIVADEPTGNLDYENGQMIMELLKEISVDRLVIVVTHNQEEADPYITRKIRLHDGEIVSDEKRANNVVEQVAIPVQNKNNKLKQAFRLFQLNFKAQPRKLVLMITLIFVLTLAMMFFIGTFAMNYDESATKILTTDFFMNHDQTRLLVRKNNGENISDGDLQKAKVKHVKNVEPYDYITDINYFRPDDYRYVVISGEAEADPNKPLILIDNSSYTFTNFSHFMRSGKSLSKDDIRVGSLPTGNMEMVVYSKDDSILNTKEIVFFSDTKNWGDTKYLKYEVEIVGILKEKSEQTYFSDDICHTLNLGVYKSNFVFSYQISNSLKRITTPYIHLDPTLNDNEISLPNEKFKIVKAQAQKDPRYLGKVRFSAELFNCTSFDETYRFNLNEATPTSNFSVGVAYNIFNAILNYQKEEGYPQFAVYLDDYAYTDDVIKDLAKLDYDSLSCYRVSTQNADSNKLVIRFVTITISLVAIVLLFIIEIVLCVTFSKIRKNDFLILKIIGLPDETCRLMNNMEMLFYGIISFILTIITCLIIKYNTNIEYLINMFKYIRFYHYLILFIIVMLSMLLTSRHFNKYLLKSIKITRLKEE